MIKKNRSEDEMILEQVQPADLVMIGSDGTIHIYDYKSDLNPGLPAEIFAEIIGRRYDGQMEFYRHVCAKLFRKPIGQVRGEVYLID